jgi:acyl-CoA synthetase (NDP forming)
VYAGIFRQLGVIEAASLAELTYVMTLLRTLGGQLGPRVGVISASGGACSLIADHVIDAGLQLPKFREALQDALNRAIPEYGSSENPVDLSADVVSRADILHGTFATLRDDESVDVWLVFGRPIVDRYYQAFIDFARASGKAVIVSCGVPIAPEIRTALRDGGVAVLDDPELCLRALGRIVRAVDRGTVRDAGAAPTKITATIEDDRDFGHVLALSAQHGPSRVVRALPAQRDDLCDALGEIAGTRVSQSMVERLGQFAATATAGRRIELDFPA